MRLFFTPVQNSVPQDEQTQLWGNFEQTLLKTLKDTNVIIDAAGVLPNRRQMVARWLEANPKLDVIFYYNDNQLHYISRTSKLPQTLGTTDCAAMKRVMPSRSEQSPAGKCWGIFYDLAHCTGADFKLPVKVNAVMTVDLHVSWDFFLQSFGRIRKPAEKDIKLNILMPNGYQAEDINSLINGMKNKRASTLHEQLCQAAAQRVMALANIENSQRPFGSFTKGLISGFNKTSKPSPSLK